MSDTEYKDIIHLSRPVSKRHPKMSLLNRAAQFSPFAALSGFEEGIQETARKTTHKRELDDSEKNLINAHLTQLAEVLATTQHSPRVTLEYFEEDDYKTGGAYRTYTGPVKKMDLYKRMLVLADDTRINLDDLTRMDILS